MPDSNVIIPLDSYRLAQYTAQVPCYICSGPNTFDAELCRHCYAPMALTHQANTQHVLPQMIATIGATARAKRFTSACSPTCSAGKTNACKFSRAARSAFRCSKTP